MISTVDPVTYLMPSAFTEQIESPWTASVACHHGLWMMGLLMEIRLQLYR